MVKSEEVVNQVVAELKRVRLEKGLSQRKLAKMTGLSDGGIRHMEDGDVTPTLFFLLTIAEALEVRIGSILEDIQ